MPSQETEARKFLWICFNEDYEKKFNYIFIPIIQFKKKVVFTIFVSVYGCFNEVKGNGVEQKTEALLT